MKNESNAPQAAPASPWWSRPRLLAVALPGTVLIAVIVGQTISSQKPEAAPGPDATEPMVRLHSMTSDTSQTVTAPEGFKASKTPLVFTRDEPGASPIQAREAAQIALPKGAKRPNISRAVRSTAGAGRITAGTTKAGGIMLQLGAGDFPYATARIVPGGKLDVQCETDSAVTAGDHKKHGHTH